MKLHITTNIDLDLSELTEFYVKTTVHETQLRLNPKFNPYFNKIWGDFNQVRAFAPDKSYDARCFFTSKELLRNVGIIDHIGMYDLVDSDGILDFYAGKPKTLDRRAKLNGFKTNEAWLIVHELCHGLLQKAGVRDCVHEMEEQGRLKELYIQYYNELLKTKVGMLGKIVALLTTLKKKPSLQPLVKRQADALVKQMELLGHPVRITEGYRSLERQAELYEQGRTTPGQIVTYAKSGESLHNYGVAVDFVFRKEGYDASNALWQTLGAVGKKHGFEWGGDWKKFTDKPHFEMPLGYSLKDFQEGKVDYNKFK